MKLLKKLSGVGDLDRVFWAQSLMLMSVLLRWSTVAVDACSSDVMHRPRSFVLLFVGLLPTAVSSDFYCLARVAPHTTQYGLPFLTKETKRNDTRTDWIGYWLEAKP
jgi:hypothetical protein